MTPADELHDAAGLLREAAEPLDPRTDDVRLTVPVVLALATWLDAYAAHLAATTHPGWQETTSQVQLALARAINGRQP